MAYTHYPHFFSELWRGLKPLCQSREFVEAFLDLRVMVEAETAKLSPTSLVAELEGIGYAPREIESIREMNTVFSHGNQPYVVIAAIARHLMEIGDMSDKTECQPFQGRHAPDYDVPFLLMEAHHVDTPTLEVYADIKATLNLPFVNTDYRAFARWPSYFSIAWKDLAISLNTPEHEGVCQLCHDRVAELAATGLPNPGGLTSKALRSAAQADESLDDIIQMCRLFQWLLPGLITNVAFLRHQLEIVQ